VAELLKHRGEERSQEQSEYRQPRFSACIISACNPLTVPRQ
jgi:hypothetical protein